MKLFPSGIVILSTGSDLRVKIWSAEDGSCPVTLIGHSGAVTDAAIVDRGKNIVTASKYFDAENDELFLALNTLFHAETELFEFGIAAIKR